MPLETYRARRDFAKTSEPSGERPARAHARPIFVVQEHHASHLHYDFRLEADGVLKSWSVPKGPSMDPAVKRLAVEVEDHPVGYAAFEGTIPKGQYGGGTVTIWDRGTYEGATPGKTVAEAVAGGRLEFVMYGERLKGRFTLVRMKARGKGKPQWLLIKSRDEFAEAGSETPAAPPRPARTAKPARTTARGTAPAEVELTHPERVLFPDLGLTKADVFAYYRAVADRLLPFLRDRPVTLERLPAGLVEGGPHFWQKNTPASYPAWVPRVELETERGKPVSYALVNDEATLLYLVNQGTLTFHPWLSRVGSLDRPDFVLFDLDPGPAAFADVVARRGPRRS
jgi:bifunctional non-homologous end joining protein LigD